MWKKILSLVTCVMWLLIPAPSISESELHVCVVSVETFNSFLDSHSIEGLLLSDQTKQIVLSADNGIIRVFSPSSGDSQSYENGTYHIMPSQSFSFDTIQFLSNKAYISEWIQDELQIGEVCISDMYLLVTQFRPMTLWVKTQNRPYYITIDQTSNGFFSPQNVYHLYGYDDYFELFSKKEAQLIIDGYPCELNTAISLYHNNAVLPLCEVLRVMGAQIDAMDEAGVWQVTVNGSSYVLNSQQCTLTSLEDPNAIDLLLPLPGGSRYYIAGENELLIDNVTANTLLKHLFNAHIHIDTKYNLLRIVN